MINQAVKTITLSNFPNLNKIPKLLEFLVTLYKPNDYFFFLFFSKIGKLGVKKLRKL